MQTAIDFAARCLSGSALAALGGMKFKRLTFVEYENLEEYDNSTFYIVTKGNKIIIYIGETTITNVSRAGNASLLSTANFGINGIANFTAWEVD